MAPTGRVIPNAAARSAATVAVENSTSQSADAANAGTPDTAKSAPAVSSAAVSASDPTPLPASGVATNSNSNQDETQRKPSLHKAAVRTGTLRRESTFRSVGSLLLKSGGQINVLRTSLNEINERVRYRWVLHPTSQLKTAWDLLSAVAVVYYSWVIPFMLCFEWVSRSKRTTVILWILDVWGALDVTLRFRTGIIECSNVVMNPKRIRDAYVESIWFPIDLVATIPFEYMIQGDNVSTRKTIKMINGDPRGDIGKELFMIVKGIVRVMPPKHSLNPAAEKNILLGEGDFFGEIGVVMEMERTRSVRAECMAELCILSRDGFDKILVEFPEFATAMKKLIIKRVGEMWKSEDDSDRMEKMTKLADWKMKRTMQMYSHVQKLRGSTHILHAFRPKTSSEVNGLTTVPNIEPISEVDNPGNKAQLEATKSPESLSLLEPISELDSEPETDAAQERHVSASLERKDEAAVAFINAKEPPARAQESALEVAAHASALSAPAATAVAMAESTHHKVLRKAEKALQQQQQQPVVVHADVETKSDIEGAGTET